MNPDRVCWVLLTRLPSSISENIRSESSLTCREDREHPVCMVGTMSPSAVTLVEPPTDGVLSNSTSNMNFGAPTNANGSLLHIYLFVFGYWFKTPCSCKPQLVFYSLVVFFFSSSSVTLLSRVSVFQSLPVRVNTPYDNF